MGDREPSQRPVATVAIVGCGRIGSEWDEGRSADFPALTHAAAFQRNSRAKLVALCDADPARLQAAGRHRGVREQYASSAALFEHVVPDIAVIATPTAVRREPIAQALKAGVRTLVCEKPLASSLAEGARLAQDLGAAKARVFINYLRRWDGAMRHWRSRVARGEIGAITRAVGWYGKGLLNNASHLIDLVHFLSGARATRACARANRLAPEEAAWSGGVDRTLDADIAFGCAHDFVLTLVGTDHRDATIFELDLLGSKGRLRITEGGHRLEAWTPKADPRVPGYVVLTGADAGAPALARAMETLAAEAVAASLGEPIESLCTPRDALQSLAVVETIKQSFAGNGAWQEINQT